jgi:hypothetical protein
MGFELTKVDVWAGELQDRPGALAEKLTAIMDAGANLDFVIVRPLGEKPGLGVLYVAPLHGDQQTRAAGEAGLSRTGIHALRAEGPDKPGLGAGIAKTLADAGINVAGLSAAAVSDRALFYVRFGSNDDLVKATQVLTKHLG